jgi:hypothetical protein
MNPLRQPAAAARREGTPDTGIDGSTPSNVDPGFSGGGGSLYGADRGDAAAGHGGGAVATGHGGEATAAGQGATHLLQALLGRGADAAWPSSPAAAASASPSVGTGLVGGGAAMAGGLQEWWNSQGATTLGPEWLASVLTAAMAPASASVGNHATTKDARVEEPGLARRRGGHGGRAPRPRALVRAASASVHVDLTEPVQNM